MDVLRVRVYSWYMSKNTYRTLTPRSKLATLNDDEVQWIERATRAVATRTAQCITGRGVPDLPGRPGHPRLQTQVQVVLTTPPARAMPFRQSLLDESQ